jgi:hypothetical protein
MNIPFIAHLSDDSGLRAQPPMGKGVGCLLAVPQGFVLAVSRQVCGLSAQSSPFSSMRMPLSGGGGGDVPHCMV